MPLIQGNGCLEKKNSVSNSNKDFNHIDIYLIEFNVHNVLLNKYYTAITVHQGFSKVSVVNHTQTARSWLNKQY